MFFTALHMELLPAPLGPANTRRRLMGFEGVALPIFDCDTVAFYKNRPATFHADNATVRRTFYMIAGSNGFLRFDFNSVSGRFCNPCAIVIAPAVFALCTHNHIPPDQIHQPLKATTYYQILFPMVNLPLCEKRGRNLT
jgi:hypothetical protein